MHRMGYKPIRIPPERWQAFFDLRLQGVTAKAACREVGISWDTICRLHNNPRSSSGWEFYKQYLVQAVSDVKTYTQLSPSAKKALKDFEYFRRRYFGHVSRPWHVAAANEMIKLLESPRKEYCVVNCPPGSGKSTLFTHDIPVWAMVRNRSLRTLIGTFAESTGQDYIIRIRTALERTMPVEAEEMEERQGLAVNAKACLVHDYGRFRPEGTGLWRADKLTVSREGGAPAHQKEASFACFGRKSSFLGGRYDLNVWDDVVNDANSRTPVQLEELTRWWKNTAESRVEPGGLLILQGQRMGPHDLYRHALDLRDLIAGFDGDYGDLDTLNPEDLPRKYFHIVYPAHDVTKCKGEGPGAHHEQTAKPWPAGCLLDPVRLSYRDLWIVKQNDPKNYACVYQQEDTDPTSVLVNPLWINGGEDPISGAIYPGCYDRDRMVGHFPDGLSGEVYSVITADPSAANFWGVQWWAYQVDTQYQHLVDVVRKRMQAPDLLDWNHSQGAFTGLLEEWWQRSVDVGRPISHVIVETNAAQRFLLQYDHAKRWSSTRGVELIAHQTQGNKADPKLGVGALAPHYRFGRVRIPGHPLTRPQILPLYNEVTRYPDAMTTDMVMAHWFLIFNAANLFTPRMAAPPTFKRPTWIRSRSRGVA